MRFTRFVFAATAIAVAATAFADPNILVYNNNTQHGLALAAANLASGSVTTANSGTFNGLLTSGTWDLVLIDSPSTPPPSWTDTINYVAGGGKVVLSYWNWHNEAPLTTAFGASGVTSFSWTGQTFFAHNAGFFTGVTMANSDWHNHWGSDGGIFTGITGTSLGGLGVATNTVAFLGNSGRTIALPVIDEAGDTWLNDGSGVQVWTNAINTLNPVPEPATMAILGLGAVALLRRRRSAK